MLNPEISVYIPEPGIRAADVPNLGIMKVPNEDVAGRTFVKRPAGTPWSAFSAGAWNQQAGNTTGYVVVSEDDNNTMYRFPMFDHPGNA